ncbi:MAG TPA: hypothetical protein VK208_23055 [Pyrinomonadaceae bacterium]|jgi:hypothetical protein|nr:hypothetical protein [Pyrinomonadaceae bacterium]
MNEENLQAIVALIALLALLAIVFVPFFLFIGYALFQKGKRSRIRQAILNERRDLVGTRTWFPVRYASEPRFKQFFKIFPWEGAGILVTAPGSVLFLGQTFSGSPISLQLAPVNATLSWLGKAPWPNGAVSWFYLATANGKHYFSSETGVMVFGSHKTTRAIYDGAIHSFQASSASQV